MRKFSHVIRKSAVAEGTPGGTSSHGWYPEGAAQDGSVLVWAAVADGGWDVYAVSPELVEALGADRVHVDREEEAMSVVEKALAAAGFESGGNPVVLSA